MFCKNLIVFLALIYLTLGAYGQKEGKLIYDSIIQSPISNGDKIEKIESLINNFDKSCSQEKAQLYYEFSKWNWKSYSRKNEAILYAKNALNLLSKDNPESLDLYKRVLYNLGYFNRNLDFPDYTEAIFYYDQVIALSNEFEVRLGKTFKEKGDIYDKLGDFKRALEYYEHAELIQKKSDDKRRLLITYINISKTLANLNDSTYVHLFNENKRKLNVLENDIEISSNQKTKLWINEGVIYNTTSDYMRALKPYLIALELAKAENETELVFSILNNLGVIFSKNKEFDRAEKFFKESRNYSQDNLLHQSAIFNNFADLFLIREDFETALLNYSQAIAVLLEGNQVSSNYYLPVLKEVKTSPYKKDILDYLIDKANGWMVFYENTQKLTYLVEAKKTIKLADQLIDILYFESREELSKLFWRKRASNLYLKGVNVCYLLSEPEKAFYYMEKNKGLLLLENINIIKAKKLANIPGHVINRETVLLRQIKELQNELTTKKYSSQIKDSIRDDIFTYKSRFEKFIDSLEIEFPQYYKYKKKLSIVSMKVIIEKLSKDELIVEYILGNEEGYVLLLSKEKVILHKIDNMSALYKNIEVFKKQIEKPFVDRNEIRSFQKKATQLFHQLFPFEENVKLIENKKIQIIPDGKLHNIPFEALTTSNKNNLETSYLLGKAEIYYQYSLSLSSQYVNTKSERPHSFVGFLPIEFENELFSSLTKSYMEINSIIPYFNHEVYTYNQATKEQFLKSYHENSIVHISTHGGVKDKIPWLAFYNKNLLLDELYFLNDQKELVVLSACKTSVGEHKKGEGLYSITRGFINSGAKSVLSTLWNANERSSSEIISQFYNGIADGKLKSTSLRAAKLSYVSSNTNTSLASPYYWSSIILTGNNNVIETDSQIGTNVLITCIILLLLLGFYFFSKQKIQSK